MRIRYAVIAAIVPVVMTGCHSGGHLSADTTPTPGGTNPATGSATSPAPTRTGPLTTGPGVHPGEQPPVLTAAAKAHTPTGALLFANYYFKALDWSIATNDPRLVSDISTSSCAACKRVIERLNSLVDEGATLSGGRITLKSAKIVTGTFRFKSDFVVEVSLTEDAEVIARPSSTPSTVAATKDTSLVFVSWLGGRWQVKEVAAP